MIVRFNTSKLSEKEAQELLALLSPYATQSLVRSLEEVDAVRRDVSSCHAEVLTDGIQIAIDAGARKLFGLPDPEQVTESRKTGNSESEQVTESRPADEPAKKRGRPKKEAVEVHPTVVEDAAGPMLSDAPTTGNAEPVQSKPASVDGPIAIDELREVINDHVSRLGMPSAQAILKKFECERVTAVMDQTPARQHEIIAALKK